MAVAWILSLVFFVGASSASSFDYDFVASNYTSNSTLAAHPSVVQVEVFQPWGVWQQRGAATILNSRYALTSAALFSGPGYNIIGRRIRAGSNFQVSGGIINYVEKENNYPTSNWTNQVNDISVVRLASAFVYSPLIQVAPIAAPGSIISNGLRLIQTGWGYHNFSNALSAVPVVTVGTSQCSVNQTAVNSTSNLLCANLVSFNISNADIGSPWFYGNITVGIVSGLNFENNAWTGILGANVAYYANWIIRTAV